MYIRTPDSSLGSLSQRGLSRATLEADGESSKHIAVPSAARRHRRIRKEESSRRCRSGTDVSKRGDIKMAKKRDVLKKQFRREARFVFVGNFEPTVDDKVLHEAFGHCGKITRIQIRCSRGAAVTIGRPVSPERRTPRDLQHASIEFKSHTAVRRALAMNGFTLHGRKVVVSDTATDLPDVRHLLRTQLRPVRGREGNPGSGSLGSSSSNDFRYMNDQAPFRRNRDRNLVMGVSFAKCVM